MIPLNFKIYKSDGKIDLIKIALKQLESEIVKYEVVEGNDIQLSVNDVAVIQINRLDDRIVDHAIKEVNNNDNPFVVLTESSEIQLAATLARYGLKNIFVMPYELQKLKTHFQNIV